MRPTSLNLTLPPLPLPSSSNSVSATDIQSLVKMSGVRWVKNTNNSVSTGLTLKSTSILKLLSIRSNPQTLDVLF